MLGPVQLAHLFATLGSDKVGTEHLATRREELSVEHKQTRRIQDKRPEEDQVP